MRWLWHVVNLKPRLSLEEPGGFNRVTCYPLAKWRAWPNMALHLTAYSLRFAALCSGFRQQLTPGVAMTSEVKSWPPIFYMFFIRVFSSSDETEPGRHDG
jgi:hypothetical protein